MKNLNLLYSSRCDINDKIHIEIPSVGDVYDHEDDYYSIVSTLTAMPIDMMVQLDDAGIDFSKINEYDLFLLMFGGISKMDTSLVFGDLDLTKFEFAKREDTDMIVLVDKENDIVIDRVIANEIANVLRKIHHLEKNIKKPGNKEAREYMIERARKKMQREKRKGYSSQLEPLIISMVNAEQFKYGYEGTRRLTIYQFNESVRQIINKVDYDNRMFGIYSGSIDPKSINQDELNWLKHK